jgi:hypothetical protein
VDRISRAEVGGPYASHDDAMRAIQNKGFDTDPADLTVQEGTSDDDSSKQAVRKQAKFPPPADSGGGATMKPAPEDPLKGTEPKDAQDVTKDPTDDVAPDDTADPTAPDNGSSLPGAPEEPVDPLGDPETQVTTTKPAQIPSGGGGGLPGAPGEDAPGMPDENEDALGSEEDVSKPPEETAIPETTDPVGGAIDQVTAQILRDNPELPHTLARKVARKVVGKVVQANALMPNIEDPLADKSPLSVVKDVVKTLPKGSPAAAPSHEDDDGADEPGHDDDDSSLPGPMPMGFQRGPGGRLLAATPEAGVGAEAAGMGAAAEGTGLAAGAAELAPLLLL